MLSAYIFITMINETNPKKVTINRESSYSGEMNLMSLVLSGVK